MVVKAQFLAGQTEARVSSLYQWDYGQILEVEAPNLSTLVEVHFACPDMKEAIVHVCSVANGVATVAIPDRCLEQSNLITAWVYEFDGSSGATTKVVYIPVVARTRPPRTHEIPQEISDKYTELIDEVNEAVDKITSGQIMVGSAAKATSADRASQADNASSAARAESAGYATNAGEAVKAINDKNGKDIATTYVSFDGDFTKVESNTILTNGTYQFKVLIGNVYCWAIVPVDGASNQASLGFVGGSIHYVLQVSGGLVSVVYYANTSMGFESDAVVYYRKINNC